VTVLNAAAAAAASVTYDGGLMGGGGGNPLARMAQGFAAAQAAARGDVLTIGGPTGPVTLTRASAPAELSLEGARFGDGCLPYVGELPGLAALDGLGASAKPTAVLGLDALRQRPGMWYTPTAIYV
jgi:hypothetical protein